MNRLTPRSRRITRRPLRRLLLTLGACAAVLAPSAAHAVTVHPGISGFVFTNAGRTITCDASIGGRSSGVTCQRARDGVRLEANGFGVFGSRGRAGYRGRGLTLDSSERLTFAFPDGRFECRGQGAAIRCANLRTRRGFVLGPRQATSF